MKQRIVKQLSEFYTPIDWKPDDPEFWKFCQTIFMDWELFNDAVEFYNQYFHYDKNQIDIEEAFFYAQLGPRLNADLWKSMMPMDESKMDLFYKITPFYFFHDIIRFMDGLHMLQMRESLKKHSPPMLEFAGGTGGFSIFLSKNGFDCTFYDSNFIQSTWMRWLIKKRNLNIKVVNDTSEITGKFRLIIAQDIAEHVINPIKLNEYLMNLIDFENNGKIILTELNIEGPDDLAPMHFRIQHDEKKGVIYSSPDFNRRTLARNLDDIYRAPQPNYTS